MTFSCSGDNSTFSSVSTCGGGDCFFKRLGWKSKISSTFRFDCVEFVFVDVVVVVCEVKKEDLKLITSVLVSNDVSSGSSKPSSFELDKIDFEGFGAGITLP